MSRIEDVHIWHWRMTLVFFSILHANKTTACMMCTTHPLGLKMDCMHEQDRRKIFNWLFQSYNYIYINKAIICILTFYIWHWQESRKTFIWLIHFTHPITACMETKQLCNTHLENFRGNCLTRIEGRYCLLGYYFN